MIIKSIKLIQFRNYRHQEIEVDPEINIFYGENAQGKTNILEAIYLCACARSHRTSRDSDLILHDTHDYAVCIRYLSQQKVEETLEIRYLEAIPSDPQRTRSLRHIFHNGLKLDKISDLMGLFHAVIFAPEDLMLIKEGPATRRRYLDLLISQVRPAYFVHLQQYARILAQRNRLLKTWRDQRKSGKKGIDETIAVQLDVWNESLAREAAAVLSIRQAFCERISSLAMEAQQLISDQSEILEVRYRSVPGIETSSSTEEIYDQYLRKLKRNLEDDIEKGITQAGPHRDDLELTLNGNAIKPFASQGQQRSAVLSLKIAELQILREDTGETPVFLLDDVMSELDENRRISLLKNIQDAQVFVTCTDAHHVQLDFSEKMCDTADKQPCQRKQSLYCVHQGRVTRQSEDGQCDGL
ncbi:MAG: DNA replication/repair protein RecF [Eubacteriales bacterium]|jgi:DNA replication and repair protein RecF|nr:DNA replication/repair protein RecF [Eubacteriales bacterium]